MPFHLLSQKNIQAEISDFHFRYLPQKIEKTWKLKASPPNILIPDSDLPKSFFFILHSNINKDNNFFSVSGPYLTMPSVFFQFISNQWNNFNQLSNDFCVLSLLPRFRRRIPLPDSFCLAKHYKSFFDNYGKGDCNRDPFIKLQTSDAKKLLELLKFANGLDKASFNYQLDFIYPTLRISRNEKFAYFIDEDIAEKPGTQSAYDDLMNFLQESEIIGSINNDELQFKLAFLLDRYLETDSNIKKILSKIGRLSLLLKPRYEQIYEKALDFFPDIHLLFASNHKGTFPIELFPLEEEFLSLSIPVLRRKMLNSDKFQASPGHSKLNSSLRLFIFCNPEGQKLEYSENEADKVFKAASESGIFSNIQLIKWSLSAAEFYQHLQLTSIFYYIGHGSMGGFGPEIDLKNGTLALSAIQSLKKFPSILFFSACNPIHKIDNKTIHVEENPDFPAFQVVYPIMNLKDRKISFCSQLFSELLKGKSLAQGVLDVRRFFYLNNDPSWAIWRIEGWPYFKFSRLKHYTFHI